MFVQWHQNTPYAPLLLCSGDSEGRQPASPVWIILLSLLHKNKCMFSPWEWEVPWKMPGMPGLWSRAAGLISPPEPEQLFVGPNPRLRWRALKTDSGKNEQTSCLPRGNIGPWMFPPLLSLGFSSGNRLCAAFCFYPVTSFLTLLILSLSHSHSHCRMALFTCAFFAHCLFIASPYYFISPEIASLSLLYTCAQTQKAGSVGMWLQQIWCGFRNSEVSAFFSDHVNKNHIFLPRALRKSRFTSLRLRVNLVWTSILFGYMFSVPFLHFHSD